MEDELERGLLLPQGGGGVPEYHRLSSDVIERTTVLIRPSRRHASARPRTARGVGRVSAGDTSLSLSLSLSLSVSLTSSTVLSQDAEDGGEGAESTTGQASLNLVLSAAGGIGELVPLL